MRLFILLITVIPFFASSCSKTDPSMKILPADNFALDFSKFQWLNAPDSFIVKDNAVQIITNPETDYWQRTYYGFRNDNGHAFVKNVQGDFTYSLRTDFDSKKQFDQCGIIVYQNSENWIKASIEYENEHLARLGSVVTNMGYSDWSTTDISSQVKTMWYRLSRRGQDFFIETSKDGNTFEQLRVLHMHEPIHTARIGIYACSPLKSSFTAKFTDFKLGKSIWEPHVTE